MKVFNEKETAAILKTAAEQSHKGLSNEDPGLTINELEVIAKEAGIDPSEISKAVEALENKSQPIDHDFNTISPIRSGYIKNPFNLSAI